jgi:uncharacterized protein (DUF1778 family)
MRWRAGPGDDDTGEEAGPPPETVCTLRSLAESLSSGIGVAMYVNPTYISAMGTKTERWTLRVTAEQDAAVRRVLEQSGESLNEYVVRHAVDAAHQDLADRRVFVLSDAAWDELEQLLDRPPTYKPALAKLLANPSVLEQPTA